MAKSDLTARAIARHNGPHITLYMVDIAGTQLGTVRTFCTHAIEDSYDDLPAGKEGRVALPNAHLHALLARVRRTLKMDRIKLVEPWDVMPATVRELRMSRLVKDDRGFLHEPVILAVNNR